MEWVAMRIISARTISAIGVVLLGLMVAAAPVVLRGQTKTENAKGDKVPQGTVFRTSDRCVACHNGLTTKDGEALSGRLETETQTTVELLDTAGQKHVVQRKDITAMEGLQTSIMPTGFEALPPDDIKGLL